MTQFIGRRPASPERRIQARQHRRAHDGQRFACQREPGPGPLDAPAEVALLDDEDQDHAEGDAAGVAHGQAQEGHGGALADEQQEHLAAVGSQGAVEGDLAGLLLGHHQQRQGDGAGGDDEAHDLEYPRYREGLVEDVEHVVL